MVNTGRRPGRIRAVLAWEAAGRVDTNARYMRDNRQGAFVGADSSDTDFVGNTAAGSSGEELEPEHSPRRWGPNGERQPRAAVGIGRSNEIRVVLQLGFTPPNRGKVGLPRDLLQATVASRLADRMEQSSWIQNRSPLEVSIDAGNRHSARRGVRQSTTASLLSVLALAGRGDSESRESA